MDTALIVIMFGLICGSYGYTYRSREADAQSRKDLWDAIKAIKENEIKHLEERIDKLGG